MRGVYYDPEADILYIVLGEGAVEDTVEVAEGVFVELGEDGRVVGIEIWRASRIVLEPPAPRRRGGGRAVVRG